MAIARKPSAKETPASVDVDALIAKGGSVAKPDTSSTPNGKKGVLLHIPVALLNRLDEIREVQTVKVPRNTWVLQAIAEKRERDEK